jgi:hypothetical protein
MLQGPKGKQPSSNVIGNAMAYHPEEIVTLNGAKMTLRTAVRNVMALPPDQRATNSIFREGEPSILDREQIEAIAALPLFKSSN